MAYIVACIEFDDNYNLKNVNILDNDSNLSIESDLLETLIGNKKKKFYIKILVNPCSSGEPDCFMLSNDNYFKLDFEASLSTESILSEAFLSAPNASSNASSNANTSSNTNASSNTNTTVPSSFDEFKKRIIEELTKALQTNPSDLDKFKARILEELTNALQTP